MISKKIAMIGMWGVGKTSLVQRYVSSIYDEKYHTTLGVKVDKKVVQHGDKELKLMLWDIAGAEDHSGVPLHYVKGAAGYLLVLDGTRTESLELGLDLVRSIRDGVGPLPFVAVMNKADLGWELQLEDAQAALADHGCEVMKTSAKTGENVETAFLTLAAKI